MAEQWQQLPAWVDRLVWSIVAVLIVWLLGQLITRTIIRRLSVWASRTAWKWDDLLAHALERGVPVWSLLLGFYIVVGFWHFSQPVTDALSKAIYVLACLSVTAICAGLIGKLTLLYGAQWQRALPATSLTENLARIVVFLLGLLAILSGLGISITPMITALGIGGLAVALALQDTLSNLFAGLYLTLAGNVRLGDYIKLESGQEGYVADIGWRETKIRMLPNNDVLVPNKKLGETIITNYFLPDREMAVTFEVGVDYASDLDRVERVTVEVGREVMRAVSGGVAGFEPFVRFHSFGSSSINMTVILRAREFVEQYSITHEFVKRLHARYRQEGIVIPFPVQTVHVRTSPAVQP